jgi:hypothetical protein
MQVVLSGNPFCCSAHEYGSALASPVTVRLAGALPSAIAATMRGATKASRANMGAVGIVFSSPNTIRMMTKNPLGLYVDRFTWWRDSIGDASR